MNHSVVQLQFSLFAAPPHAHTFSQSHTHTSGAKACASASSTSVKTKGKTQCVDCTRTCTCYQPCQIEVKGWSHGFKQDSVWKIYVFVWHGMVPSDLCFQGLFSHHHFEIITVVKMKLEYWTCCPLMAYSGHPYRGSTFGGSLPCWQVSSHTGAL